MFRPILRIIFILLLSCFTIYFIWLRADIPNRAKNGFNRVYKNNVAALLHESGPKGPIRSIIGDFNNRICLSTDSPSVIVAMDSTLQTAQSIRLKSIQNSKTAVDRIFSYAVDSSVLYLLANQIPAIISFPHGHLSPPHFSPVDTWFIRGCPTGKNTFVLLKFLPGTDKPALFKYNTSSNSSTQGPLITGNGAFSDGSLLYAEGLHTVCFVPYYHNSVLTADTNLHIKRSFRTLDTFTYKGNELKIKKRPPLVRNQRSCVFKNLLFVCSNLKADNEKRSDYFSNIPVDVYDISSGKYRASFYLPLSGNKLIGALKELPGNRLIVLYQDGKLAVFTIHAHLLVSNHDHFNKACLFHNIKPVFVQLTPEYGFVKGVHVRNQPFSSVEVG